jgi:hypothetical protein
MDGLYERVPLPDDVEQHLHVWRGVGAIALLAVWGWHAFVRDTEVPILVFLDIAVHEVGHVLFRPFGELVMLIMGSGFEVLFPFAVGLVFLLWKHDPIAFGICMGWSSNACADSARYIADAPHGSLMLMGGGPDAVGDWERILGEEFFDKVFLADRLSGIVRSAGLVLWLMGVAAVVATIVWRRGKATEADRGPRTPRKPLAPLEPIGEEQMWR